VDFLKNTCQHKRMLLKLPSALFRHVIRFLVVPFQWWNMFVNSNRVFCTLSQVHKLLSVSNDIFYFTFPTHLCTIPKLDHLVHVSLQYYCNHCLQKLESMSSLKHVMLQQLDHPVYNLKQLTQVTSLNLNYNKLFYPLQLPPQLKQLYLNADEIGRFALPLGLESLSFSCICFDLSQITQWPLYLVQLRLMYVKMPCSLQQLHHLRSLSFYQCYLTDVTEVTLLPDHLVYLEVFEYGVGLSNAQFLFNSLSSIKYPNLQILNIRCENLNFDFLADLRLEKIYIVELRRHQECLIQKITPTPVEIHNGNIHCFQFF